MVKSILSDEEITDIMGLCAAGNPTGIIKYVNNLLYYKGLGSDSCARPFALREQQHMAEPCFAVGYIDKLRSYMTEASARDNQRWLAQTQRYADDLKAEIHKFFKQEQP